MNHSNSILNTIKKALGIAEDYTEFDLDIIMHINSVFLTLNQLGVGPASGFRIENEKDEWDDYVDDDDYLDAIKTYIYLKVKTVFDPPLNSTVMDAMKQSINELEWRLNIQVDKE